MKFPENFFWGASTAAHQVEGANTFSDWWQWEQDAGLKDVSGEACRHYSLFNEDFDIARSLHHNAHRFSVEWSRIEPWEGQFSAAALAHYKNVISALRTRGIEPLVTLHHFTNPLWFASRGGWESKKSVDYFLRYVEKTVEALGQTVQYWITINEPLVYIHQSYILGLWPPQKKSLSVANTVKRNLLTAHVKAYRYIHDWYRERNLASPLVSIAKNMQAFEPCGSSFRNKTSTFLKDYFFNFHFIEQLLCRKSLDFIGVNYYTRGLVDVDSWDLKGLLLNVCTKGHSTLKKNFMGWDIYPAGLYALLMKLKKYKMPVYILENGICTADDNERWEYIRAHLEKIHAALGRGVDIRGYMYWSLMDNFEWDKGFAPRFGLVDVNYDTYERIVRKSALKFARVCQTGILE